MQGPAFAADRAEKKLLNKLLKTGIIPSSFLALVDISVIFSVRLLNCGAFRFGPESWFFGLEAVNSFWCGTRRCITEHSQLDPPVCLPFCFYIFSGTV